MGTAQVQGELWGAQASDWARLQEPAWRPVFEAALDRAGVAPGCRLLDVGCGAGGALAIARERGASVSGLDASENLVAVARERLPGAPIEIGEMEALPFPDASFDIVTGINAFQFAGNLVQALREARRVCRPGGAVLMLTWGRREDCQLMSVTMAPVLALLPPPPAPAPGARTPGPMLDSGAAEAAMRDARLDVVDGGEFDAELVFPDEPTAIRALLSAGVTVRAVRVAGEDRVVAAIRGTLPQVARADGSVAWRNRFRWTKAVRSDR
ncbi:MAG TPA: class I SAM-dependent methyltransferase [Burkholderiaceae bacterium]|nr:class I SAM-dependent methyltransferase [Burkholderiaceae bacterium]